MFVLTITRADIPPSPAHRLMGYTSKARIHTDDSTLIRTCVLEEVIDWILRLCDSITWTLNTTKRAVGSHVRFALQPRH